MAATKTASTAELTGWVTFLRAHAAITRELSAELQREHGLTLHDYEVLLHLARADGSMMRRVDLSKSVLLSASGITRLLEGLERAGFVEKATCQSDGRVSYAKLTDTGRDRLREAAATHVRGVEELFASRYSESELETLAQLLERLPLAGSASTDCGE
jgi:DNA-binding MarR family transcriptional regulator